MTIGDYIERTRLKLADTVQTYRFSATDVAVSLNEALNRARQVRPSLCYSGGRLIEDSADVNFSASVTITVRPELDRYSEALVFLAAARVLGNDNADTNNAAVAENWRNKGLELLTI